MDQVVDLAFFKAKKIFITGHTGFKGSWICEILKNAGAEIMGYGLLPLTEPNLFTIVGNDKDKTIHSVIGDIRDLDKLSSSLKKFKPEIVIHLAAQPLVRESYEKPVYTYETNVMGTVNILESIRYCDTVRSFLNVTTDKVYENKEWEWGYRENETLNGYDPYANSKSCSELITHSYKRSYFNDGRVGISTARAGNVIGGGDFSADRIIPDCIKAICDEELITIRNPSSIRPYQHVLEPLFAYLLILKKQYVSNDFSDCYNVGPNEGDCIRTKELVEIFCNTWGSGHLWETKNIDEPHEANFLKLDCSRIKTKLNWTPCWNIEKAIVKTVFWSKEYLSGNNMKAVMKQQILEYVKDRECEG